MGHGPAGLAIHRHKGVVVKLAAMALSIKPGGLDP
jgi:hypothetical protein